MGFLVWTSESKVEVEVSFPISVPVAPHLMQVFSNISHHKFKLLIESPILNPGLALFDLLFESHFKRNPTLIIKAPLVTRSHKTHLEPLEESYNSLK